MYFDNTIKSEKQFCVCVCACARARVCVRARVRACACVCVCVWINTCTCHQEKGQWNSYIMRNFSLYFNVWHRGGGGSEHVSTRTCGESLR